MSLRSLTAFATTPLVCYMAGTGVGIRSVPCTYVWQVLASAFAQYYIFAYIIFIALCIITSPMLLVEVFGLSNNMPVHYIYTHAHT